MAEVLLNITLNQWFLHVSPFWILLAKAIFEEINDWHKSSRLKLKLGKTLTPVGIGRLDPQQDASSCFQLSMTGERYERPNRKNKIGGHVSLATRNMDTNVDTNMRMQVYMIYMYLCDHIYVYVRAYIYIYISYISMYVWVCMRIYIYIHIHIASLSLPRWVSHTVCCSYLFILSEHPQFNISWWGNVRHLGSRAFATAFAPPCFFPFCR